MHLITQVGALGVVVMRETACLLLVVADDGGCAVLPLCRLPLVVAFQMASLISFASWNVTVICEWCVSEVVCV